ncbi:hypothetical protein NUACC26_058350 [Scytonema sp. NUACC26]
MQKNPINNELASSLFAVISVSEDVLKVVAEVSKI